MTDPAGTTSLILHGAAQPTRDLARAAVFDTLVGTPANVVQQFWSMQEAGAYTPFPIQTAAALWVKGQLYLHTWGTQDWKTGIGWFPQDVVAGKYDSYLHEQAALIAGWKHPLFVRLDHEFNGPWVHWFAPDPAAFVAMWQHIVGLIKADGATNITWVWCPNVLDPLGKSTPYAADKLAAYYPGDLYVDWTATDVYNWGPAKGLPWLSLAQRLSGSPATNTWIGDTYATIQSIAPYRPMMLSEMGCHTAGGDRLAWLREALAAIPASYPQIRAVCYYNVQDGGALWPLLASDGSAQAWAAELRAGPYALSLPTMPPDLKPIVPLQSLQAWGDPLRDLTDQLARSMAGYTRTMILNTDLTARLEVAITQAGAARASLDAVRQTIRDLVAEGTAT